MPRTNYSTSTVTIDSAKSLRHRIKILRNIVLILLAVILVRLFFIQIIEHDAWLAKADEEHTLLETIVAKRGEIYPSAVSALIHHSVVPLPPEGEGVIGVVAAPTLLPPWGKLPRSG